MGRFIRNKKLFFFLIIFFLLFSLFIRAGDICGPNCDKCVETNACNIDTDCAWDSTLNKCCRRLEVRWPNSPAGTSISGCSNVTGMVKYLYEWGIAIGGLAAFIAFVIGGFQYLTSMGEPAKMKEAKDRISSAVFGLVLLLTSWLILNTINPELTKFRADLKLEILSPPGDTLGRAWLTPCEFALLYRGKNWVNPVVCEVGGKYYGKETNPLPPGLGRCNLGDSPKLFSYIIFRKREITNLSCPVDPTNPPSETSCSQIAPTGEGNIVYRCTVGEANFICVQKDAEYNFLEPCDPEAEHCCDPQTIDPQCNDYYKSGGACIMELYYESSWWVFGTGGCGDKIGSIGMSAVSNTETYLENPSDIRCVKLIEITPR